VNRCRCCEEQDIALDRDIAFALAVADLLELPDDLPLLPAVTAAMSIPTCLRDPGSLAGHTTNEIAPARVGNHAEAESLGITELAELAAWLTIATSD
jgi:hypothetical protein